MSSIERKVWIFKTEEVKPKYEDSFDGFVLALSFCGDWHPTHYNIVAREPERWPEWMQYPDLVQHRRIFGGDDEAY